MSLFADMIIGLNVLRVISGQPIDRAFMHRVIDHLVVPLGRESDQIVRDVAAR